MVTPFFWKRQERVCLCSVKDPKNPNTIPSNGFTFHSYELKYNLADPDIIEGSLVQRISLDTITFPPNDLV